MKRIISKILGFFQSDVTRLTKDSSAIVDVFTSTVRQLEVVNSEIDKKVIARNNQIANLTSENESFSVLKSANEKVITKLSSILD